MKDLKERLHKVCVIGATPAGIAATNKLGEMGIPVTLIDCDADLNEKLASDKWRMPSGVSLNYALRPGLLRILRNPQDTMRPACGRRIDKAHAAGIFRSL